MDFKKVGKGLLIAMGGAGLTYMAEQLPGVDFGAYTALVVALASAGINFAKEWLKSKA